MDVETSLGWLKLQFFSASLKSFLTQIKNFSRSIRYKCLKIKQSGQLDGTSEMLIKLNQIKKVTGAFTLYLSLIKI